jgi:hypothetical protein
LVGFSTESLIGLPNDSTGGKLSVMVRDRITQIARHQDGLITRAQALWAGMSPDAWKHATRKSGTWQRVLPGIYATFSGPLGDLHRLRAAVLHAGNGARITGAWACWMHGLHYGPKCSETIMVVAPRECRRGSS